MEYTENQTQASRSRRQFLKGSAVTGVATLAAAGAGIARKRRAFNEK